MPMIVPMVNERTRSLVREEPIVVADVISAVASLANEVPLDKEPSRLVLT